MHQCFYIRSGQKPFPEPTFENEKYTDQLLPPSWDLAFDQDALTLVLFTHKQIVSSAHLSSSEAHLFHQIYDAYPHCALDTTLSVLPVVRAGQPSVRKATFGVLSATISDLRRKLQQVHLDVGRVQHTGYVLQAHHALPSP